MAIDKKKFNEKRFVNHVPLPLFKEFLSKYEESLPGVELATLDTEKLFDLLLNTSDDYPGEMAEALHQMNDLCRPECFDQIIHLARDQGIKLLDVDEEVAIEELAMRAYLRAPRAFQRVWDEELIQSSNFPGEWAGKDERDIEVSSKKLNAFKKALRDHYQAEYQGDFCRITDYDDEDEINFIIRHGSRWVRETKEEGGEEQTFIFRPTRQDLISYDCVRGMIKVKARREDEQTILRDLFAEHIVGDKRFFDHDGHDQLYTLEPLKAKGTSFEFTGGLGADDQVTVCEMKIESDNGQKRFATTVSTKLDVLEIIDTHYKDIDLSIDEIIHVKVRFRLIREGKVRRKTVKIKPPSVCHFDHRTMEDSIMKILRENKFVLR